MFKAKDVMKVGAITTMKQTNIYEAIELLVANKITGLPVVDEERRLIGIVTEKDMLKLLMHSLNDMEDNTGTVQDFMTTEVISFDADDSLVDVGECFIENAYRCVPITADGKVVGIISRGDIMEYILSRKLKTASTGK